MPSSKAESYIKKAGYMRGKGGRHMEAVNHLVANRTRKYEKFVCIETFVGDTTLSYKIEYQNEFIAKLPVLVSKLYLLITSIGSVGLNLNLNENNSPLLITYPIDELAKIFGRNIDNKNTKNKFKTDIYDALRILGYLRLEWKKDTSSYKKNGKVRTVGMVTFLSSFQEKTDDIQLRITGEYRDFLHNQPTHYFHEDILKIDQHRAYNFHIKLASYASMPNNNKLRGNMTHTQCKKLKLKMAIEWAGLPSFEDVDNSDRHFQKRIIEPLGEILNHKHGMIAKWHYADKDNNDIAIDQHPHHKHISEDSYILMTSFKQENDLRVLLKLP